MAKLEPLSRPHPGSLRQPAPSRRRGGAFAFLSTFDHLLQQRWLLPALLVFTAALCIFPLPLVHSQENYLTYGDVIYGEITEEHLEHRYTFSGSAGDVVAIEMLSVDRSLDNKLIAPVLILLDPNGGVTVNTALAVPLDDTTLVAALETDGEYTIIATRDLEIAYNIVGEFMLRLLLVPEVDTAHPFVDSISNEDSARYYFTRPEAPFLVHYTRLDGDFTPQVNVSRLNPERGGLENLVTAVGRGFNEAMLGIFEPGEIYIISLHEARFDFQFDVLSAEYELRIIPRG